MSFHNDFHQDDRTTEADIFRSLYKLGVERYIAELNQNIESAFGSEEASLTCIDEGILDGKVRMPGSGILDPGGMEKIAKMLLDADVDVVTSHDDCGAARIANSKVVGTNQTHNLDNILRFHAASVNEFAFKWTKRLAERLSELKGKEVLHKHIGIRQMSRPSGFHPARIIYINRTKKPFNPTRINGLPKGFVISGGHLESEQLKAAAEIAVSITLGSNGLGEMIDKNNPLIIALIEEEKDRNNSTSIMYEELAEIVRVNGDKVFIDSFRLSKQLEVAGLPI